jgi:thioredoxin reductase (NADPH)
MSGSDVVIVGAGPSGLSAAIAAKARGLDYLVVEQGVLVNSIYRFPPQLVFFTTPELLEIGGLPLVSPYDKPTRTEALRYYRRVADTYDLQISYGEQVLSVGREAGDSTDAVDALPDGTSAHGRREDALFAVETRTTRGVRVRYSRHVILAIGYYDHPVMLNVPGEDLPHVHHYQHDPHACYRQRVIVVGGGNSAAEAALELFRAGAQVTLVHRRSELKSTIKYWVRPDIENRIKEGSIAVRFNASLVEIRPTSVLVGTSAEGGQSGSVEELAADTVFLLTGYRADSALMRAAGIELNDREAPMHDPETFETNVPGLFVAGGAIAGIDTGTIFIENGRFHGEKIIEVIARRS